MQNCGATDDGLVDVRPNVELWGLEKKTEQWHEIRGSNEDLTDLKVSEIVLAEDWSSTLKAEMDML